MNKQNQMAIDILDRLARIILMLNVDQGKLKLAGGVCPYNGPFDNGYLEKSAQGKYQLLEAQRKGRPLLPVSLPTETVNSRLIGSNVDKKDVYGNMELHLDPAEYDKITPEAASDLVQRMWAQVLSDKS